VTPTVGALPRLIAALQPIRAERIMRAVNTFNAGWLLDALEVIEPLARRPSSFFPLHCSS
jgi:hypothetical protein